MKTFKFYVTKIKEIASFLANIRFSKVENNQNILIYGISRGGTTLLAETLVSVLKARLVWEPLFPFGEVKFNSINPYSVKRYAAFKLGWHPHMASQNDKAVNAYFDDLFNLKVRNIRFFRFTNPKTFSESNYTIHKLCFGNFMYSYFQKRYHFKSIILLRHPFAIAASSLGFGNHFNWHKENYSTWSYEDTPKSGAFFKNYIDKNHLIVSGFSLLVFQAVSQFSYALNHLDENNSVVVFYEDLVYDPKIAFHSIQEIIKDPLDFKVFSNRLDKQSFSSQKGHTKKDAMAQLSKWKSVATQSDISNGLKIFEAFDFKIYSDDILPLKVYSKQNNNND